MATAIKPGRSEEASSFVDQLEIAQAVRQHFDELAPKRPLKPGRSEFAPMEPHDPSSCDAEFRKFQSLEAQTEPLIREFPVSPSEEFVETEYYKDLNAVDRSAHHTIGTGFIKIETNNSLNFNVSSGGLVRTKSQCNPATNDWIPSPETAIPSSDKPARSDP